MRILVLGDIHGRFVWRYILEQENFDIVVFLGDYVSTDKISEQWQIANLKALLKIKEDNYDKVILLRGNHDMQHLGYKWAECSGLNCYILKEMLKMKERFENDTQWLYRIDNIIFSHAGITYDWLMSIGLSESSIDVVNNILPNDSFGFSPDSLHDTIGISKTQGLTWVRPTTLMRYSIKGFIQIVGHTPVENICKMENSEKESSFWFCDALPQYLVIEDGEFFVKKCNSL